MWNMGNSFTPNVLVRRWTLSLFLLTMVVAGAYVYISRNLESFIHLSFVEPAAIVIIILLFISNYLAIGLSTDILHRHMGVPLTYYESFALSIITGFYNLITPFKGGMAARAVYLKKRHNFSYTDFVATLAASYIIIFLAASIVGMASTYLIYAWYGVFSWILFGIFAAIFLPLAAIVVFSPRFREPEHRWLGKVVRVVNGWHLIKGNPRVIGGITLLSIAQLAVGALMLSLQFRVFGIEVPFVKALFLSATGSLSLLIAITPAGLGISEAVTVFSALTIGITPAESLSAAILGRLVSVVVLFILGPIFSYLLIRPLQR